MSWIFSTGLVIAAMWRILLGAGTPTLVWSCCLQFLGSFVQSYFSCARMVLLCYGMHPNRKTDLLNPCQNWLEISRNWASVMKAPGPEGQWKRGILPESSVLIKTHAFSGEWHGVRCKGQKKVECEAKTAAGNVLLVFSGIFVLCLLGHTYSCKKLYLDIVTMCIGWLLLYNQ